MSLQGHFVKERVKESKYHTFFQEGQEGFGELQANKLHLDPSNCDGITKLEAIFRHIKDKKVIGSS